LNHKKQILDIYQVIIFISQYSTQLRLDKQGSSPLLSDHYPARYRFMRFNSSIAIRG